MPGELDMMALQNRKPCTRHSTLNPAKQTQLHTQHIPNGITGEFDIMTCRDLGNGEVQYFRIRYD
jgi:hypothetical protein